MNNKCKICGSHNRVIYHKRLDVHYYYCAVCEFIAKDSRAMVSAEEAFEIYNTHRNSLEDPRYVAYFKRFLEQAVFNYCSSGKNGLDFGSGPEPVLSSILKQDYGYEMDIYDLYYAPEKSYKGKKYDLITSTEVIEHVADPIGFLNKLRHLLADDGILAVMTRFHPNDEAGLMNWHYLRDQTHISFFTPTTMKVLAQKTGLRVRYSNDHSYTTFELSKDFQEAV